MYAQIGGTRHNSHNLQDPPYADLCQNCAAPVLRLRAQSGAALVAASQCQNLLMDVEDLCHDEVKPTPPLPLTLAYSNALFDLFPRAKKAQKNVSK